MRITSKMALLGLATLGLLVLNSTSDAATVNFDVGVTQPTPFSYTENGLQFGLYGDAAFVDFNGGKAIRIGTVADVIIARVGGGSFSLNSILTLGPNYTLLLGWVNAADFVSGGNNNNGAAGPKADVVIDMSTINPNTIFPTLADSRWGAIQIIDFCGYCITSFGAGGGIDDLNFSVASEVPLPATLPLFAVGAGLFGLLGWRRKKRATET